MPSTPTRAHFTDTEEMDDGRERRGCICGWRSHAYEPEPEIDSPEWKISRSNCPGPLCTCADPHVDGCAALDYQEQLARQAHADAQEVYQDGPGGAFIPVGY